MVFVEAFTYACHGVEPLIPDRVRGVRSASPGLSKAPPPRWNVCSPWLYALRRHLSVVKHAKGGIHHNVRLCAVLIIRVSTGEILAGNHRRRSAQRNAVSVPPLPQAGFRDWPLGSHQNATPATDHRTRHEAHH